MKSEKAKVERCEIPKHRGEKHALSLSKGVAQPRHAELVHRSLGVGGLVEA